MDSATAGPDKPKDKTKAQKRYLKRKKERRKNRKAATSKKSTATEAAFPTAPQNEGGDDAEDSGDESTSGGSDKEAVSGALTVQEQTTAKEQREKRPKKKRKINEDDREEDMEMGDAARVDPVAPESRGQSPPSNIPRSPTPLATLPSFPLPALPNAPSKSVLALQGLDKALVDAEIVDSATVLPIPSDRETDGGTRLSEKTRRRLQELGITDLFSKLPFCPSSSLKTVFKDHCTFPTTLLATCASQHPRGAVRRWHMFCRSLRCTSTSIIVFFLKSTANIAWNQLLSSRIVTRLRALVVLPTRDLVIQVRETFEAIGKGRGLQVCAHSQRMSKDTDTLFIV
jgi:ATP-dependent RNA helicase DDX51/DBP6